MIRWGVKGMALSVWRYKKLYFIIGATVFHVILSGQAGAKELSTGAPISLIDFYDLARSSSQSLSAVQHEVNASKAYVNEVGAALLPQVTFNSQRRWDESRHDASDTQKSSSYGLTLTQSLLHMDSWYDVKAAQSKAEQRTSLMIHQEHEFMFLVVKSYLDSALAERKVQLYDDETNELNHGRAVLEANMKVGTASRIDVQDAKLEYDRALASRQALLRVMNSHNEKVAFFANSEVQTQPFQGPGLPTLGVLGRSESYWLSAALSENGALIASRKAIQVAEQHLKKTKAEHLPTLDASLSYAEGDVTGDADAASDRYRQGSSSTSSSVRLKLSIPLYLGGRTSAKVTGATEFLYQVGDEHEQLEREVVSNVRRLYRVLHNDQDSINTWSKIIQSSRDAIQATQIGVQIGTRNMNDLIAKKSIYYQALRGEQDAQYEFLLDELQLKFLAGNLRREDVLALSNRWNRPVTDGVVTLSSYKK